MHSFRFIIALLFAFVATSYAWPSLGFNTLEVRKDKGNGTEMMRGGDPVKQECRQMRQLEKITKLAANQTKLDALVAEGKMNTSMVDALKAKAAEASTKLQAMSSNTTLTTECAAINAEQQTKQDCRKMKKLKKLAMLAGNQTALDAVAAKKKLNSTQVDKLKEKVQMADAKLKQMSSNTTLTELCSKMQQQKGAAKNGTSTSSGSKASSTPTQAAKNSASDLTATGSLLVFIPALAAVFAVLL